MLANRLKILLAERDLSIKDVVNATGLTRPSISNMVNNPFATIAIDNVDKLCNYLEVSPKEFFDQPKSERLKTFLEKMLY